MHQAGMPFVRGGSNQTVHQRKSAGRTPDNLDSRQRQGFVHGQNLREDRLVVRYHIIGHFSRNPKFTKTSGKFGLNKGLNPLKIGSTLGPSISCPVPCDYLPKRSYPLFRAREVLEYLALGGAGGSPEGDQRLPPGPAPRRG